MIEKGDYKFKKEFVPGIYYVQSSDGKLAKAFYTGDDHGDAEHGRHLMYMQHDGIIFLVRFENFYLEYGKIILVQDEEVDVVEIHGKTAEDLKSLFKSKRFDRLLEKIKEKRSLEIIVDED